jgi:hypothetical protein
VLERVEDGQDVVAGEALGDRVDRRGPGAGDPDRAGDLADHFRRVGLGAELHEGHSVSDPGSGGSLQR